MKYEKLIACALIFAMIPPVYSCKSKETPETEKQPVTEYTEPSVPDGFVFPDGSVSGEIQSDNSENTQALPEEEVSDLDSVVKIAGDIGEIIDFAQYSQPKAYEESGFIVLYDINDEFYGKHTFDGETVLGTEKIQLALPTSTEDLISAGYIFADDTVTEDTVISADTQSCEIMLCTPETQEVFGFIAENPEGKESKLSVLPVIGITLTSVNNFTSVCGVNGKSGLMDILKLMGSPDFFAISSNGTEKSVMLEYTDTVNKIKATVLADGTTYELIALKLEKLV